MDIATAAQSGGTPLMTLVIVVAGVIIFILGSLLWWMTKTRFKEREIKDMEIKESLKAGRDQFAELRIGLKEVTTGLVPAKSFERYCEAHEREHAKINENMSQISNQLQGLDGKMDANARLLSRLVRLGVHDEVANDD